MTAPWDPDLTSFIIGAWAGGLFCSSLITLYVYLSHRRLRNQLKRMREKGP